MGLVAGPGLFRLILALAVLVSHVSKIEIGRIAVLLFFYLSGYWVTRLWRTRFSDGRLLAFYGSRFVRIWPLYIVSLVITVWILGGDLGLRNILILGVASKAPDPLYVSWSLDVELQFYLILPVAAWLLTKPWRAAQALLVVAVTAGGWWLNHLTGVVTVAQYLPAFVLGLLTWQYDWRPGPRAAALSLIAFLAGSALLAIRPETRIYLTEGEPDPLDWDVFAFLWMLPLLPYVAHSLTLPSGALDRRLGELSYPLYLIHMLVIVIAANLVGRDLGARVLACGLAVIVALVLYRLLDRPIDAWRQRVFEPKPLEPDPQGWRRDGRRAEANGKRI